MAAGLLAVVTGADPAFAGSCSLATFTMPVTMEGSRASVPVKVNGKDTRFWLDSGAWFSIMSQAKADELDLKTRPLPFGLTMQGIGGSFQPTVAKIKDFAVVGSELHNVDFMVGGTDAGNGLIGRNLLAQSDTEFDLPHGIVKLIVPKGCDKMGMAYWAPGKAVFTVKLLPEDQRTPIHEFKIPVMLGKAEINAAIDSGAATIVSRHAAERAGIDLKGPGVVPLDGLSGFGRHFEKGWLVPVPSISVGDETILHAKLAVIDGPISAGEGSPDMLLGIDFLLAHHLYVSRRQHLIYFTYSGGNPFAHWDVPPAKALADKAGAHTAVPAQAAAPPSGMQLVKPVDDATQPTSADEFSRRAAARLAKDDVAGAIADYSQAIRLAPDSAANFEGRAQAYGRAGDRAAARADFDRAIALAPDNARLLLDRAWMRHAAHEDTAALADAQASQKLLPPASLDVASVVSLYDELGLAGDAVHLLDAVISAHGDDVRLGGLLNNRCWSRALANTELDAALSDCNRALTLTGKAGSVRDSRALVLYRQHKFAAALAEYNAVLGQDPKQAWSLYMRGATRIALGQADAGKADETAALKLKPELIDRARQYRIAD